MKLERLLCPVDFTEATPAGTAAAVSLATEYGCSLRLLHVLNYPYAHLGAMTPAFDIEAYYADMEAEAASSLTDLVDDDVRRFADVDVDVVRGVPYLEILRAAERHESDLIVMPTHGRTGLGRLMFGSTTEKIVRQAPCAVLTVHPGGTPAFRPAHVVMATDFSPAADAVLPRAVDLARCYGARLTLVHVVTLWESDPANPAWRFPVLPEELRESVADVARRELHDRSERCAGDEIEATTLLTRGFDPAAEIVRVAVEELHADLIVMGTHGHTGIAHTLLGSVAEKVVRTFPGAVMTVRYPGPSVRRPDHEHR